MLGHHTSSMNLTTLVRTTLWITVPANLTAAIMLAFPTTQLGQLIELPQQSYSLYTLLAGSLVGLFGLAYAWLAKQKTINRPMLLVGACGKTAAVLISVVLFAMGQLSGVATTVISGDLIFATIWFIWLYRGMQQPHPGDG